jgi:hypothetical protein
VKSVPPAHESRQDQTGHTPRAGSGCVDVVTLGPLGAVLDALVMRRKSPRRGSPLRSSSQGDATWSHGGSLPGTTSILVRSYHDFSWVAVFNARSPTGNFDGELDAALWAALARATSLPTHDLFSTSHRGSATRAALREASLRSSNN